MNKLSTTGIILVNPKYAHNVGGVVRAASCFLQNPFVIYTGKRVALEVEAKGRLPREERMKGYRDVILINSDDPFSYISDDVTPVCVEILNGSENILDFYHPDPCVYVFGPEDGSVHPSFRAKCHRFIKIATKHCLNLSAAVNVVLYDRLAYQRYKDSSLEHLRVLEP